MGGPGVRCDWKGKSESRVIAGLSPAHYKTLIAVLERAGFIFHRQRGDHLIYTKPGLIRPPVIPAYHEVPVFIIKNLLRTAGISREQYLELVQNL